MVRLRKGEKVLVQV